MSPNVVTRPLAVWLS